MFVCDSVRMCKVQYCGRLSKIMPVGVAVVYVVGVSKRVCLNVLGEIQYVSNFGL